MRFLFLLLLPLVLALGLGGLSANWALEQSAEFGNVAVGPWIANPLAGSVNADPYSKARLARLGNLTLGIGEGAVFRATRDSAGEPLRRDCSYSLEGQTPPARVWTLSAFTPEGRLIQPGEGHPGWLVSTSLLRQEDNTVQLSVGPSARPGNWLSVSGTGPLVLAFTLYDTPASASSGLGDLAMPRITRSGCVGG